jgi:hypothetical protein
MWWLVGGGLVLRGVVSAGRCTGRPGLQAVWQPAVPMPHGFILAAPGCCPLLGCHHQIGLVFVLNSTACVVGCLLYFASFLAAAERDM